jgi:REP element-mobilizing transposase RayT
MHCQLLECNGEGDHVHLLVICPPKLAVANLVEKLKGKSSFVLRRDFGQQLREKASRSPRARTRETLQGERSQVLRPDARYTDS